MINSNKLELNTVNRHEHSVQEPNWPEVGLSWLYAKSSQGIELRESENKASVWHGLRLE